MLQSPKELDVQWAVRLRFRSYEDGMHFANGRKLHVDKIVYPFKALPNGDIIINPEWGGAPWELEFSIRPSPTIENVTLS